MARRSKAQLAETRRNLIECAQELFAERGFGNTQIADITDRAGVGISTFYRQFSDKTELLSVVVQDLFDDLRQQLVAARAEIDSSHPIEQLLTIQRTYDIVFQSFHSRRHVALTMLQSGYGATPTVERMVWDSIDGIVEDIVADLERAEARDLVRIERKRDFGDAIIGMVMRLSHRMLIEGSPTPVEASRFCTRFTVGAMAAFMPRERIETLAPLLSTLGD
jgi:AcrR family transcriptional regulator